MLAKEYPSADYLNHLFTYDNGKLKWKNLSNPQSRVTIGAEAGTTERVGYRVVVIHYKLYKVHRIIWIMHNGSLCRKLTIDHLNGMRLDNRIENLSVKTHKNNTRNTNKSKGYSYCKKTHKYYARIVVNGALIQLGGFKNESDARKAYVDGKLKYHGVRLRS